MERVALYKKQNNATIVDYFLVMVADAMVAVQTVLDQWPPRGSLYRGDLHLQPALSAALAGEERAGVLGVAPEAPVMEIRRLAYDALDQVVELRTMTFRTDTHAYFVSLT